MKPSKSTHSPKRKHKLSSDFENQHKASPLSGKRTRANSNVVDEFQNVKRSSRIKSRNLEAFGELANNYNIKKSSHDLDEPIVSKRAKRSSTCSSSSSVQSVDPDDVPPPPTVRRGRPPNKKKEHVNGTKRTSISNGNTLKNENGPKTQEFLEVNDDENKIISENINSPRNGSTLKFEKAVTRSSNKSNAACPANAGFENNISSPKRNGKMELFSTDENQPENETIALAMLCTKEMEENNLEENGLVLNKNRRTRRLSQKGEMASVIEFVFNQKKNENLILLSTPKSNDINCKKSSPKNETITMKTTSPTRTEEITVQNEEPVNPKRSLIEAPLTKVNDSILVNQTDMEISIKKEQNAISSNTPQIISSVDHSVEIIKDNDSLLTDTNLQSNDTTVAGSIAENEFHSTHNTVQNLLSNDEINNISTDEDLENIGIDSMDQKNDDEYLKWRKRSLRSSGVKCQPDFYALSLDLMIHRNRKRNSETVETDDELNNSNHSPLTTPTSQHPACSPKTVNPCEISDGQYKKIGSPLVNIEDPQKIDEGSSFHTNSPTAPDMDSSRTSIKLTPTKSTPGRGRGRGKGKWRGGKNRGGFHRTLRAIPTQDPFEPPPLFKEEPPTGPDVYYFESDHVALKHNTDYHCILKTYAKLEAQRRQAMLDLDKLQSRLQEGLNDPITFVDSLQQKVNLDLPYPQQVPSLPDVDWLKYVSQFGTFEHVFSSNLPQSTTKHFTRRKKSNFDGEGASSSQTDPISEQDSNSINNKSRSQTFKKNWSVEEQRKLEELLLKYPQEHTEFNRFRKIAAELKDRTPLQVQSRIQKYFIKLAKAGLPIPGRMPRLDRNISSRPKRYNRIRTHHPQSSITRISTFFSDFHVPVKMGDEEEEWGAGRNEEEGGWDNVGSEQISDEEDIPNELRFSDTYLEILRLKRKRKKKLCVLDNRGKQALAEHFGYQCDICKCEPIKGVRFHCIDCPPSESIDLCQSCIRTQSHFEAGLHKSNHRMEPVYASLPQPDNEVSTDFGNLPGPYTDNDYTKVASLNPTTCEYNYLDTNYLPPKG